MGRSTVSVCWRAIVGVYSKLVPLTEHWRLLGAHADDSRWSEWASWLLQGNSEILLQANSASRTVEAVECTCL